MKMRNLTGAIRKTDGPVFVDLNTSAGVLRVPLQKTGLLTALKDLPLDPQDETEMSVDDAGLLTFRAATGSGIRVVDDVDLAAVGRAVEHGFVSSDLIRDEQIDLEELTGEVISAVDHVAAAVATKMDTLSPIDDDLAGLLG